MDAKGFGEITRAIEQRDLHQPLMDQMHQPTDRRNRPEQRNAKGHVGHLTDGRVGQALLQFLLLQSAHRAIEDRCRGQPEQRPGHVQLTHRLGAIDVIDHPDNPERAGLDHRHRMQQRANGCRRHHRLWQPAMQRDQRRLDPKPSDQQDEGDAQRQVVLAHRRQQVAARLEVLPAGQAMQQRHAHQYQRTTAHGVGQIDAPGAQRFRRTAMHHQRERRQRQHLVEQQKADQIARQREAYGGAHAKAEVTEEARLQRRIFKVANGVNGSGQPQHRRQCDEQQRQRIALQHQRRAGKEWQTEAKLQAFAHAIDHRHHQQQLDHHATEVERDPQPMLVFVQGEDQKARHQRAEHDGQR